MAISPSRGTSIRRRRDEEDRRYSSTSYRADNKDKTIETRGRGRAREFDRDDDDLVDYIHERNRLPRTTLKHRETSREGKRRHEYRYYEPQPQRESRPPPRIRSVDRHRSTRREGRSSVREREDEMYDRSIPPRSTRRMSMSGPAAARSDDRRENNSYSRRDRASGSGSGSGSSSNNRSRRRASVSFDHQHDTTGKKRSQAQNLGKAAIAAGALEAVRQRGKGVDDRGAWKRVATAALGAAAIDAAATKVRGRDPREQGKKSTLGASLGGLMVEGLVHRIKT